MLSFENFVKSMLPSLSELKVTPSFCFAFKIPDNVAASNIYMLHSFLELIVKYLICHNFKTTIIVYGWPKVFFKK